MFTFNLLEWHESLASPSIQNKQVPYKRLCHIQCFYSLVYISPLNLLYSTLLFCIYLTFHTLLYSTLLYSTLLYSMVAYILFSTPSTLSSGVSTIPSLKQNRETHTTPNQ